MGLEVGAGACSAAKLNEKLREQGIDKKVTVQTVCRVDRDEAQVREALEILWKDPGSAWEIMAELRAENDDLYRFEKMLETVEKASQNIHRIGCSRDSQPFLSLCF